MLPTPGNRPNPGPEHPRAGSLPASGREPPSDHHVTVCNHTAGTVEVITQRRMAENGGGITVHLPAELPSLTTPVSRILLAILVELTEVEIAFDDRG